MSGHSHWAGIKHKKKLVDAKRGKLFSKLTKQIMVAARNGGGDPNMNMKLKYCIDAAKAANMTKDTIDRAIKKGCGNLDGVTFQDVMYEGYAPGGVAIIATALTDNKNRTVSEVRKIFEIRNGNLGEMGSVAWMFDLKGVIIISAENIDEDALIEMCIENGADSIEPQEDIYEITCDQKNFSALKQILEDNAYKIDTAQIMRIPSNFVTVDKHTKNKILQLIEVLEDHDDIQEVFTNLDFDN